jgi:glycosyltransferase involved in cell wall biosynthesis
MLDVKFATIYPTGPLSLGSRAAVARLVSQVTTWLAEGNPGQVAAVCLPESHLEGVTQFDLSLPQGQKILFGITRRVVKALGFWRDGKDEGTLRTQRGVSMMVASRMKPKVILTATACAAILCRWHFPEARIILWVHAAPERKHELLATHAFRAADALVLPSRALYDLLWDRFAFEEFSPPVWIIHNYIDLRQFFAPTSEQRREARSRFGLCEEDFAIVHLSRGRIKGLQIVEAALPLVRTNGQRFVLLSAGDKVRETRSCGSLLEIRRLGQIPIHELRALYHAADLGVVPSVFFETFSLAAVEMMTCGVCVVASKSGGLPEVIVDGRTGRIVARPNDVELWASVLQEVISDDVARRRLADEGRAEALGRFDGTTFYEHWTRLINTLFASAEC